MTHPDILVVGAGHNGLVTAAYLAKAGRRVLVLERASTPGGQLANIDFGGTAQAPALHPSGHLRPDVVSDLGLARHGLATTATGAEPACVALLPDGGTLGLASNATDAATLDSIRRLSARDAARWPEFVAFMNGAAAFLDAAYRTPMPRMARADLVAVGLPLASLALRLRRLGRKDLFRVIRSLSMSVQELTADWFEAEPLKAAIGALAIHGATLGAFSAGTGYTLIHNWLNRGGLAHRPDPDGASLTDALVAALRASGGELRSSAPVAQILVERQQVTGVRLASGETIAAKVVVSGTDPRHTLLDLVGAPELPPEFVWHTQSIKMRGSVAKVHLLTDGRHGLPSGTLVVAPTLRYLERAYDAAKYGEISREPYLEVTTAGAVVSIHFQFAPFGLRGDDWSAARATVEKLAIDTLAAHHPALVNSIREVRSITPLDLERDWGLTEGDLNHGQPILDQLFFMRPLPGWSDHRTPVDGLYLCGSGVHGGGGISGASGRNAARAILKTHRRSAPAAARSCRALVPRK
jgi:phytoene dehydrogenase-like protein